MSIRASADTNIIESYIALNFFRQETGELLSHSDIVMKEAICWLLLRVF